MPDEPPAPPPPGCDVDTATGRLLVPPGLDPDLARAVAAVNGDHAGSCCGD